MSLKWKPRALARVGLHFLALFVLGYAIFMFGNNVIPLTNPDEVFYAQTAKEMIRHKTWLLPYLFDHPQFEKPILTYWLLRLSFIFFGTTAFAARFFPALFAMSGTFAVYGLGLVAFGDQKKAFLSAWILMSSAFFIGMARVLFTDMIFSVWILLALAVFWAGYVRRLPKGASLVLFSVFSAAAVLTKGPLGLLIPLLTVFLFLAVQKDLRYLRDKGIVWASLVFCAVALPWYVWIINKFGADFTHEFFINDHIRRVLEAEHPVSDNWYFYPVTMVAGMFPWSIFVLGAFLRLGRRLRERDPFVLFLACWILSCLLIFQPAHSKLTSYILPLFPALSLLAADFLFWLEKQAGGSFARWGIANGLGLVAIPTALIFALRKYPHYVSEPQFVYAYAIGFCVLIALLVSGFLRFKKMTFVILSGFGIPVLLTLAALMHRDIAPYVSSRQITHFLKDHDRSNTPVLASKMFVRGVRYYTDRPVAALNLNGKDFFSPHPIAFINTDEKLRVFLGSRPVTYGIVRSKEVQRLRELSGEGFSIAALETAGDAALLKIQRTDTNNG
ncbi:MAG: glycosyltransferase family 39 protein [Candidatus Omnitrophota bacterium]